jgi:N-acetyl-alpha-D-muramate 1-phosphate uridylyltransferase
MPAAATSPWPRTAGCAAAASARWPFVYAGVVSPALFAGAPDGPFSLNLLFDRAIDAGRLYGLRLEGVWMHVGAPEAIAAAERAILASAA